MLAAGDRVATVIGAWVAVVTADDAAAIALASGTFVIGSAGVAVVAAVLVGHGDAAVDRVAGIVGAGVAVTAEFRLAGQALAVLAGVTLGADVAVGARGAVGGELAT